MNTAASIKILEDCFEAGMDFETAYGCAGLSNCSNYVKELMLKFWNSWEEELNN